MSATFPIIVKTLKKEEFTFHVSPEDTVLALKQQIEKQLHHEVAAQKLIFTGKILVDTQTIKDAEIREGNFLVLLPSARKPGAAAAAPPATASPTTTAAATPSPAVTPAAAAPTPAPTATTPAAVAAPPPSTATTPSAAPADKPAESPSSTPASLTDLENDLATGSDYEAKIAELVSMGFDRTKAVAAMEAAFNNVMRAAEYLISGIPSHLRTARPASGGSPISPPSPTSVGGGSAIAPPSPGGPPASVAVGAGAAAAAAAGAGAGAGAAPGGGDSLWDAAVAAQTEASAEGGSGALDFLRNLPYFNQLRMAVQANPGVLPLILQQLAQSQPQVLQLIQAHQQEFISLLSEPVAPSGPQVVQIQLTPEESQSVQNLIALGFDRNRVLQAFLACDKNETAAANFLLENAAEDDEDLGGGAGGDASGGLEDDGDYF